MPQPEAHQRKTEKKAAFSPHCKDETTQPMAAFSFNILHSWNIPSVLYRNFQEMTLSNGCYVTTTRNVPKSSSSTAKTGNRDSIKSKSLGAEMKQHNLWRAFSFDALHSWNIPSVLYRKFQEMILSNGCYITATRNVPKGSSSTTKTGNRDS